MRLESLRVEQVRNLSALELCPDKDLTVIAGQNGQGKTNLLESIWMLSGAKSFRAAKEAEVVRRGASWCRITGRITNDDLPDQGDQEPDVIEIAIRLDPNTHRASRQGKKNGVDYGRAGNLAGQFPCVVFAPGHIDMVSGAPEGRRRFLDSALCQLYPGYLDALRRYTRALTQKNACLKDARSGDGPGPSSALLDSFDAQLAAAGAFVAKKRREYTAALAAAAAQQYHGISDGRENLQMTYAPSVKNSWEPQALTEAFLRARPTDLRAGFCTAGVHRDDIDFALNGTDARTYASQGQRRSIVLSAKIAELELIGSITGTTPVLLLDDVLSELDDARQDYLLGRIEGKQVFITSCNPSLFAKTSGKIVTVENGTLI